MPANIFWKQYFLVSTGIVVLLLVLHLIWPQSNAISPFSFAAMGLFSAVLIFAYMRSSMAVRSSDPYLFIRLMLMLFLVKFFICLILVAVYWKIAQPQSKLAILPFFLIYLIYTTFEVYFLDKIARYTSKTEDDQENG